MCGIAGRAGSHAGSFESIARMTESITHRGPDEDGFFVVPGIEMGMRRLSIIDVTDGHQPAFDESRNIVVVFNGEIYNFGVLRRQLEARGHTFSSASDTEVIAHLYEDFGEECLTQLRGMFAIAIWDAVHARLILARDRVGKKPLVYRKYSNGDIDFASEARALFRPLGITPSADLRSLNRVLAFGYADSPFSAFGDVHRLPPGCVLTWEAGVSQIKSYWHADFTGDGHFSDAEVVDETQARIDDAVRARLVSERPLGAFLSGGIDSTVVTALMARNSPGKISTFTVGFNSRPYDESKYARDVAEFLGTDHHELILEPDPQVLLQSIGSAFDEPFADSSTVPTWILSQFAREHVVVALSGDGGDEVFSGYDRYRWIPKLQRFNSVLGLARPFRGITESVAVQFGNRKLARLAQEFQRSSSLPDRYCAALTLTNAVTRSQLWSNGALQAIGVVDAPEHEYLDAWASVASRSRDPILTMTEMDLRHYLPGDLLVKVDIASMAHSLEVRSPLLDQEVIAFAQRIPVHQRIRDGKGKWVLQQIAQRLVPDELIDRPKMGFAIPRSEWLRGPLHEMTRDLLTDSTARNRGWLRMETVNALLDDHARGRNRDNAIWPLLMIELWARNWLD